CREQRLRQPLVRRTGLFVTKSGMRWESVCIIVFCN
ncbi:hypothetical protein DYADSP32_2132, partial [Dyadobacter sp. 32]